MFKRNICVYRSFVIAKSFTLRFALILLIFLKLMISLFYKFSILVSSQFKGIKTKSLYIVCYFKTIVCFIQTMIKYILINSLHTFCILIQKSKIKLIYKIALSYYLFIQEINNYESFQELLNTEHVQNLVSILT